MNRLIGSAQVPNNLFSAVGFPDIATIRTVHGSSTDGQAKHEITGPSIQNYRKQRIETPRSPEP